MPPIIGESNDPSHQQQITDNPRYNPCPPNPIPLHIRLDNREEYAEPATGGSVNLNHEDDRIHISDVINPFPPSDKKKKTEVQQFPPLPPRDSVSTQEHIPSQSKTESFEHSESPSSNYVTPIQEYPKGIETAVRDSRILMTPTPNQPINTVPHRVPYIHDDNWESPASHQTEAKVDYSFIPLNHVTPQKGNPHLEAMQRHYRNIEPEERTNIVEDENVEDNVRARSDSEFIAIYSIEKFEAANKEEPKQPQNFPSEYVNIPRRPNTLDPQGNRRNYGNYDFENLVIGFPVNRRDNRVQELSPEIATPIERVPRDDIESFSSFSTVHEDEEVAHPKEVDAFASCNNSGDEDVVQFWSHHRSTRRGRRVSKDLLNKHGFLTDSSENNDDDEERPTQNSKSALKNPGLTEMLKMEGKYLQKMGTGTDLTNTETTNSTVSSEIKSSETKMERHQNFNVYETSMTRSDNSHSIRTKDNLEDYVVFESRTIADPSYPKTVLVYEDLPMQASTPQSDAPFTSDKIPYDASETKRPQNYYGSSSSNHPYVTNQTNSFTDDTPVIPFSTKNFFESWSSATVTESKATEFVEEIPKGAQNKEVINAVRDPESDSTIDCSSSDDGDLDGEAKLAALKQKLEAHHSQTKEASDIHMQVKQSIQERRKWFSESSETSSFNDEAKVKNSSLVTHFPVVEDGPETPHPDVSVQGSQWSHSSSITYQVTRIIKLHNK